MKQKDKLAKPTSAGRVAGEGLSTKWSEYYKTGRKERKTSLESQEVKELKAKVAQIPQIVEEQVREHHNLRIKSAGEEMRELNLGEHTLGPGGYRVAEPIWDKQDAERAEQGLPPLFEKYRDKQTKNYVRARYKEDPVTKELTTDPKVKALELLPVRNTPPRN